MNETCVIPLAGTFLPRDADYAAAKCLSVRRSHAGIVSKRLHTSWKFFFHHPVAPPF